MSPGLESSHFLMASMSFSLAPSATLVTISVTRSFDSTSPDVFSDAASPAVPIMDVIMLAMSIEVSWIVSG